MFTQFQYCHLCRINHKKKRKHIYSIRHQNIVNNILEKYMRKITESRNTLSSPLIENSQFERGAKFWCHFCVEENLKHMELDTCTVKYGGLIEHIAGFDHKRKMYNFFYENKVDESKRHPDLFHMKEEDLKKFKEKVAVNAKKYDSGEKEELHKAAEKIRMTEAIREHVVQSQKLQPQIIENAASLRKEEVSYTTPSNLIEKKATLLAKGEGLTFIGSHMYSKNEGNIHSGAPPPWLLSSNEDTSSNEIGPTMDTYKAHLEMEKKKKLPANRVGAKFDHGQNTDQSWLPSFGRVWSKGGRQQSKKYFQRMNATTISSVSSNQTTGEKQKQRLSSLNSDITKDQRIVNCQIDGDISLQSDLRKNAIYHSYNGVNIENPEVQTLPFHHQHRSKTDSELSFMPRNVKPYVKKRRPESSATAPSESESILSGTQFDLGAGYTQMHGSRGGHLSMNHFNHSGNTSTPSVNNSTQFVNSSTTQWNQSSTQSTLSRTAQPYVRKRKHDGIGTTGVQGAGYIPMIPTPILEAKAPPTSTSKWKGTS